MPMGRRTRRKVGWRGFYVITLLFFWTGDCYPALFEGLALWNTAFSRGEAGIPINGLIWMGDFDKMLVQIEAKMKRGISLYQAKNRAINFEEELALLRHIRAHFSAGEVELRRCQWCFFSPVDAMEKAETSSELDIHSIEQPIRAGQWEEMARLTSESPLPIALDEELIGCNTLEGKQRLLSAIRPQYIILKPSLHGGFTGEKNDCRGRKAKYRLVDNLCFRVEYRSECHRTMVRNFLTIRFHKDWEQECFLLTM